MSHQKAGNKDTNHSSWSDQHGDWQFHDGMIDNFRDSSQYWQYPPHAYENRGNDWSFPYSTTTDFSEDSYHHANEHFPRPSYREKNETQSRGHFKRHSHEDANSWSSKRFRGDNHRMSSTFSGSRNRDMNYWHTEHGRGGGKVDKPPRKLPYENSDKNNDKWSSHHNVHQRKTSESFRSAESCSNDRVRIPFSGRGRGLPHVNRSPQAVARNIQWTRDEDESNEINFWLQKSKNHQLAGTNKEATSKNPLPGSHEERSNAIKEATDRLKKTLSKNKQPINLNDLLSSSDELKETSSSASSKQISLQKNLRDLELDTSDMMAIGRAHPQASDSLVSQNDSDDDVIEIQRPPSPPKPLIDLEESPSKEESLDKHNEHVSKSGSKHDRKGSDPASISNIIPAVKAKLCDRHKISPISPPFPYSHHHQKVIKGLQKMGKNKLEEFINNPRSRKVECVLKELIKDHQSMISKQQRREAESRIPATGPTINSSPDNDVNLLADFAIDWDKLPGELINSLGDLFQDMSSDREDSECEPPPLNGQSGDQINEKRIEAGAATSEETRGSINNIQVIGTASRATAESPPDSFASNMQCDETENENVDGKMYPDINEATPKIKVREFAKISASSSSFPKAQSDLSSTTCQDLEPQSNNTSATYLEEPSDSYSSNHSQTVSHPNYIQAEYNQVIAPPVLCESLKEADTSFTEVESEFPKEVNTSSTEADPEFHPTNLNSNSSSRLENTSSHCIDVQLCPPAETSESPLQGFEEADDVGHCQETNQMRGKKTEKTVLGNSHGNNPELNSKRKKKKKKKKKDCKVAIRNPQHVSKVDHGKKSKKKSKMEQKVQSATPGISCSRVDMCKHFHNHDAQSGNVLIESSSNEEITDKHLDTPQCAHVDSSSVIDASDNSFIPLEREPSGPSVTSHSHGTKEPEPYDGLIHSSSIEPCDADEVSMLPLLMLTVPARSSSESISGLSVQEIQAKIAQIDKDLQQLVQERLCLANALKNAQKHKPVKSISPFSENKIVELESATTDKRQNDTTNRRMCSTGEAACSTAVQPREENFKCPSQKETEVDVCHSNKHNIGGPSQKLKDCFVLVEKLNPKSVSNHTATKSVENDCPEESSPKDFQLKDLETADPLFVFDGHQSTILDVKMCGNFIFAASQDGYAYMYMYGQGLNVLVKRYGDKERGSVTCLALDEAPGFNSKLQLFTGTENGWLYIYRMKGQLVMPGVQISNSIQCIEINWGYVFCGTKTGCVVPFHIETRSIKEPLSLGGYPVLCIKSCMEGPRRVLVVASRNQPIEIRDAMSGLLLRSIRCQDGHVTIYSLLLTSCAVYCGTSSENIYVYNFQNGELIQQLKAGKGIVSMKMLSGLLFACGYDSKIYIFDMKSGDLVSSFHGPGNMVLCLDVNEEMIVCASKDKQLCSYPLPVKVKEYIKRRQPLEGDQRSLRLSKKHQEDFNTLFLKISEKVRKRYPLSNETA